jgi:methylase of polypeptide subunit release factors
MFILLPDRNKYLLSQGPNDEHANEQQDFAHHMYLMTLEGRLHTAPLVNPHLILDIGTGTGIWAMYVTKSPLFLASSNPT